MNQKLGRLLLAAGVTVLIALFAWEALADGAMHIIEVRRNIPLADQDPVYRDFYINAGAEAGLKPNMVVTAVRKVSIKDASGTQAFGELLVPVGQLKVIFVQNRIAVAREYKLLSRDDLPMIDQTGLMTGDQIDIKGAFIDNRKPSAKTTSQKETTPSGPETATAVASAETAGAVAQASPETAEAAPEKRVSNKTE